MGYPEYIKVFFFFFFTATIGSLRKLPGQRQRERLYTRRFKWVEQWPCSCIQNRCKFVCVLWRNDQKWPNFAFSGEREREGQRWELHRIVQPHHLVFTKIYLRTHKQKQKKESDVFPLTEVNFDGFFMPAPRDWRKILKSYYGDFMTIPYREPPANIIADALQGSEEIVKSWNRNTVTWRLWHVKCNRHRNEI